MVKQSTTAGLDKDDWGMGAECWRMVANVKGTHGGYIEEEDREREEGMPRSHLFAHSYLRLGRQNE